MNQSMASSGTLPGTQVAIPCQVCGKESDFLCYNCQKANYCSQQHQKEHWKAGHRSECSKKSKVNSQRRQQLQREIFEARKNYYENYSNKIFNQCLLDVKLMTGLSLQLLRQQSSSIRLQLQYGASVCLLIRTHMTLNDNASARHQMQNYLKSHKKFLYQIERYKEMLDVKSQLNDDQKEELQMKLNLISGIANLCYVIGMNTAEQYYVLYTRYVISCFGEDSFEASNCYFLVGCLFSEQGSFNKAIACFEKAAKIRGQLAGDCMFNIGVLYKLMNNLPKALQTLQVAIRLRQQQYGQDSNEVAEVNQLMGSIFTDLNDYKTALVEYQKAFRVRCTNPISPQYEKILDLIHQLYQKLSLYIKLGQPNMKRPQIYTHLMQQIDGQSAYWQNQKYRKFKKEDQEGGEKYEKQKIQKYKKKKILATQQQKKFSWKNSGLLNISDKFISTLNLSQLFRLSQLQLQLQVCQSVFNLAYIVGTSLFFQSLRTQKKSELQKQNQKLFQLMRMQDIGNIKHKDE